jgi:gas vesicle protein
MKGLPGILIGLAAGAILGVLLAPESGRKNRKRVGKEADGFFSDLQEQLQSGLENIKSQYDDHIQNGAARAKEVIGKAERQARK